MSWLSGAINTVGKAISKAPGPVGWIGKGADLAIRDGGGSAGGVVIPPHLPTVQQVVQGLSALTYAERQELLAAAETANPGMGAALMNNPEQLLISAHGGKDFRFTGPGPNGPNFQATFTRLITDRVNGVAPSYTGGWYENQVMPPAQQQLPAPSGNQSTLYLVGGLAVLAVLLARK